VYRSPVATGYAGPCHHSRSPFPSRSGSRAMLMAIRRASRVKRTADSLSRNWRFAEPATPGLG
jgi:hypothetical protein